MNKLHKDELAYILLDSAIGLYNENKLWCYRDDLTYKTEWEYLASMRLVCKKWKKVIDKYIFRYIKLKAYPLEKVEALVQIDTDVITIVEDKLGGHQFKCKFTKIIPIKVVLYKTFLKGGFEIQFKYGMKGKRMKRKATMNVYTKTEFNDKFHSKNPIGVPEIASYTWTDKNGSKRVIKGWKKMIGQHFLQFIVNKTSSPWYW